MKIILLAILLVLIVAISGCTEQITQGLSDCTQKCADVCQLVNTNHFDLDGFNLQLKKTTDKTTLSCGCSC